MEFNVTNLPPDLLNALPPELLDQVPLYNDSAQGKIYATICVCLVVAYVALALRLCARRMTRQPFGLDDLFAALTVGFTTISAGLLAYVTRLGVGRHEIVMVVENIQDFDPLNKALIALTSMYPPIIFCIKASILLLYRRIFPSESLRIACYVLITFTALYALTGVLVLTISCLPSHEATDLEPVANFKCSEDYLKSILLVTLITNVVLDGIILCLPLPLIWRLKTNLRRRLQLTFVFTLGSFIFVISIIRVVAIKKLSTYDDNWDSTEAELWSLAEAAVGTLTISLPIMPPVLRPILYRKDGSVRLLKSTPKSDSAGEKGPDNAGILTFGRTGFKGRRARGWDELTKSGADSGARTVVDIEAGPQAQQA